MRRVLRLTGTIFLVLGGLALVWGFATWKWGDPVTGLYTRWKQHDLAQDYDRIVDRYALPAGSTTSAGGSEQAVRSAAVRFRKAAVEGEAIGRIKVSRLGLDMILVNGTNASSLRTGPGRDLRTYMPGEGQLVYIAGHRTTYAAPFAHIDRLRVGDRVILELPYATAVYRVTRHVIVPADDIARLESHGRELVALQACHPRFSARERYIVYATPVAITPRHAPAGTVEGAS
jgi:sortase A